MARTVQTGTFGFDFISWRRRDMDIEIQHLGCLQPGVADIVRISDPGDGLSLDRSAILDERENIGQNLARMVFIGQAVDHRNP
jgi:hypothetical protein